MCVITAILDGANHGHVGGLASVSAPPNDTTHVGSTLHTNNLTCENGVGQLEI